MPVPYSLYMQYNLLITKRLKRKNKKINIKYQAIEHKKNYILITAKTFRLGVNSKAICRSVTRFIL